MNTKTYITLSKWNDNWTWPEAFAFCAPKNQAAICSNTENCYFGNYPTLVDLKNKYGEKEVAGLIAMHLKELNDFSNVGKIMTKDQIIQEAKIILTEYYYLEISELMRFFLDVKSGVYGEFYGTMSGITLGRMMQDFLRNRKALYQAHINQVNAERQEKECKWKTKAEYNKSVAIRLAEIREEDKKKRSKGKTGHDLEEVTV